MMAQIIFGQYHRIIAGYFIEVHQTLKIPITTSNVKDLIYHVEIIKVQRIECFNRILFHFQVR